MSIQRYIQTVKYFSDEIVKIIKTTVEETPIGTMGIGACVGAMIGKPLTYSVQYLLTDLFWKHIVPYTFGKVSLNEKSAPESKIIGLSLTLLTNAAITYAFNKYVIAKAGATPYFGEQFIEEHKSFGWTDVFLTTGIGLAGAQCLIYELTEGEFFSKFNT